MRRETIEKLYGPWVLSWLTLEYGYAELYWMTEIAVARRAIRADKFYTRAEDVVVYRGRS